MIVAVFFLIEGQICEEGVEMWDFILGIRSQKITDINNCNTS